MTAAEITRLSEPQEDALRELCRQARPVLAEAFDGRVLRALKVRGFAEESDGWANATAAGRDHFERHVRRRRRGQADPDSGARNGRAEVIQRHIEGLHRLLLDRTALLTLAEVRLLDQVLATDLDLAVLRSTFDSIVDEEPRLRSDYRPVEHDALQRALASIEKFGLGRITERKVDDSVLDQLRSGLPWSRAYELALALRDDMIVVDEYVDLTDVPEAHGGRVTSSKDLLEALVRSRHTTKVSYADADKAEVEAPSVFKAEAETHPAELNNRFLLTATSLRAWSDVELLEKLAAAVTQLVVSPLAENHIRERVTEQQAYHQAITAVTFLRERLSAAVESGRIVLLDDPDRLSHRSEEQEQPTEDHEPTASTIDTVGDTADAAAMDKVLRRLTRSCEAVYAPAAQQGRAVWADDAATHLYLDPLGPRVRELQPVALRSLAYRLTYPEVRVVSTADILQWMERSECYRRANGSASSLIWPSTDGSSCSTRTHSQKSECALTRMLQKTPTRS